MSDRPSLSVRELAEFLGIGPAAVRDLINRGELNAVDISLQPGGRPRWRILPDDLDRFLARRKRQTPPPRRRNRKRRKRPEGWGRYS